MYFLSWFHLVPFQYRLLCLLGDISIVDRVSLLPLDMHIYFTKENVVHHLTFNMNIELEQIKHFCFVLITLKIISLLGNGHYDIRESKIWE
jgi:hypothetical protein